MLAKATESERGGLAIHYFASKDNRQQRNRTKALPCREGCCGGMPMKEGAIDWDEVCPAHFPWHVKEMIAKLVGVNVDELVGPVFAGAHK